MARTNLHELASNLLAGLANGASNGTFEGKLREIATTAGLNSVRTAEAVKLLEEIGRIEVVQRGRRGRETIIKITSTDPVTLADAEAMLPSRQSRRSTQLSYEEIGRAVVDRLLELARDDGLRSAQVEAFSAEATRLRERVVTLQADLDASADREEDLRVKLRAADEALTRAEENLRKAIGGGRPEAPTMVPDEDVRAVLDVLRTRRP